MPTNSRRSSFLLANVAAFALYALLAVVVTYPLVTVLTSRFAGHPFSDSYELARHNWWLAHALRTGQPLFDAPLLAYPDGLDGALLWAYPLQSWPAGLLALVMPLPAAFNLSLLLRLALNSWAVWLLARHLTGDAFAALVAGAVFITYPTFQAHLAAGHTGLLALWPFALYAYALLRLRATGARRWIFAGAILFAMSAWGSTQMLIFTTAPLTVAIAFTLLVERNLQGLARLVTVAFSGGLLALVFALPLLLDTLREPGWLRLQTGVVDYSADLLAIFAPSYQHPLTGDNPISARILGRDPFESTAYVGVVAAALALVGVWKQRAARWWLGLAFVAWVFSLGPLLRVGGEPLRLMVDGYDTGFVLPWAALYDLPLVNITRAPGRFHFLVGFCVALAAGFGVQALRTWLPRRWHLVAALAFVGLITFDAQFWWRADSPVPDLPTVEGVVPAPITALAAHDDVRAVLDLPWAHPLAAKQGLWLQTGHQRPLIAGHMARQTPVDPAKLTLLEATLEPALLRETGVDVVIVHREWDDADGELEARARRQLGGPVYEDARLAVFRVPPTETATTFTATTFTALPAHDADLRDEHWTYVYTPAAAAADLTAMLDGTDRVVTVLLDEQPVETFLVTGVMPLDLRLTLTPGFHRITLTVDPPCPSVTAKTLNCRHVMVSGLAVREVTGG